MRYKRLNTEEFIRSARLVHGDKYDYSQVNYTKSKELVNIICPKHGLFKQRPSDHLHGCGCKYCGINKRNESNTMALEQFIKKAVAIHGDKLDFSKTIYVKSKHPVTITCKVCGEDFSLTPNMILRGRGCTHCGKRHRNDKTRGNARPKLKSVVYGVGINDYELSTTGLVSYHRWNNMLQRCYDKDYLAQKPTYIGCSVCEEWKHFSKFKEWFDANYIDGYVLDKDVLYKGNKVYSPETCCFIPAALNSLLTKRNFHRGCYPIGVQKTPSGRFLASMHLNGKSTNIGSYDTVEEAFVAYKNAKETHIKEVAEKYYLDGKITKKVYNALVNYKVEITD